MPYLATITFHPLYLYGSFTSSLLLPHTGIRKLHFPKLLCPVLQLAMKCIHLQQLMSEWCPKLKLRIFLNIVQFLP